jgi:hypothetical protein
MPTMDTPTAHVPSARCAWEGDNTPPCPELSPTCDVAGVSHRGHGATRRRVLL